MLSEKVKLEEELKLLEESFELDVITKEEFESAKQRIESRLKESEKVEDAGKSEILGSKATRKLKISSTDSVGSSTTDVVSGTHSVGKPAEDVKEESVEGKEEEPGDKKEEEIKQVSEPVKEEEETEIQGEKEEETEIQIKELTKEGEVKRADETQKKLEEIKEEKEQEVEEKPLENQQTTNKDFQRPSGTTEEVKEEEAEKEEAVNHIGNHEIALEEEKKSKKIWIYVLIILIFGLISGYFFFSGDDDIIIACSSDNECIKEGSIGICNDSGTEDSECGYIDDVKIKLTVLSNDCFNCGTGRVMSILNGFFLNLDTESIDFDTEEGKEIASKLGITALPAYIFNSSVKDAYNYNKFSNAFNEIDDVFVMKNTVANANYYLDRKEIPNKLDLFFKTEQSASKKAEENVEEFLNAFGNVEFKKHDSNSLLAKQLGINSFPAFLINNKIKFAGVQAADAIKENFCQMNDLDECDLELAKSLV